MLYGKTVVETLWKDRGGEGVGCGGRYLWYTPYTKKAEIQGG